MCKKVLILIFLLSLLFSCSTLSPFHRGEYSTLLKVFGREGDIILVSKKPEYFLDQFIKDNDEIKNRARFLTLCFTKDYSIMGAVEGNVPADAIRFVTGKNIITERGINISQPDSGLFTFTDGDVRKFNDFVLYNRKEILSEEICKKLFENDFSIYINSAANIKNSLIKINEKESYYLIDGALCFDDSLKRDAFFTKLKTYIISLKRQNRENVNISELENTLKKEGSEIVFSSFKLSNVTFRYLLNKAISDSSTILNGEFN